MKGLGIGFQPGRTSEQFKGTTITNPEPYGAWAMAEAVHTECCDLCRFSFEPQLGRSKFGTFRKTWKEINEDNKKRGRKKKEGNNYVCSKCGSGFPTKRGLLAHGGIHRNAWLRSSEPDFLDDTKLFAGSATS